MQRMLDGMRILNNNEPHSFLEPKEHIIQPWWSTHHRRKMPVRRSQLHRAFRRRAGRGERVLLQFLFEHINTPEFHVASAGSRLCGGLAQQVTKHRGVDDFTGTRKLQRHTVDGAPLIRRKRMTGLLAGKVAVVTGQARASAE
jgi:hypothetical protein